VYQKLAQHTDEYVDVLGERVHYIHAGSGRPMVLIHGLVGSSLNWRKNTATLAEHASVYAIDLANIGRSGRIEDHNTGLEATAERVAAAMDALGLEEADIAGHSHGGAVALMLAARYPERVRSLVLFAPANPYCTRPGPMVRLYTSATGKLLAKCAPYLPRPIHLLALGRMYGDPARVGEGCIEGYIDSLRVPGRINHILAIVRDWFADMVTLKAALPLVAGIPTLLLWGDCDRAMSVGSGMRLQQEIAGSELVVMPGGGHVLFEELPQESNRHMVEWLKRDLSSARVATQDLNTSPAHPNELQVSPTAGERSRTSATMPQLSPGT